MAEDSMHTWDFDGTDDLRLSYSSSYQTKMTWKWVILCSLASFETLEIESDTGSHQSAIDHNSNKEGER